MPRSRDPIGPYLGERIDEGSPAQVPSWPPCLAIIAGGMMLLLAIWQAAGWIDLL